MDASIAGRQQREIYAQGMSGITPLIPTDFYQLESKAKKVLSKKAYAYIAGGAGLQNTIQNNLSAFSKVKIRPKMLKDSSQCDMSIELLGKKRTSPVLLCPIGVLELAHPGADIAVGKAAASLGVPFIFSSQASEPMEKVSQSMASGSRWFQLYWSKSDDLVKSFVERAERCQCEAIVVTLDTTLLGWRPYDLNLGYLPFLEAKGIGQYMPDPVFNKLVDDGSYLPPAGKTKVNLHTLLTLLRMNYRYEGSFFKNLVSGRALRGVRTFTNVYSNPALSWKEIAKLKKMTDLPIFLKGIHHPDDVSIAVSEGVNGIIVSNHGGRQVDGAIGIASTLPEIAEIADQKLTIIADSGVRSGADVFKALALGANAVCIGRPYAYGLAIGGETGVRDVILHILAELELTMRLTGCRNIDEIDNSMISIDH